MTGKKYEPAAVAIAIPVKIKKQTICSASFIAVLNLIIERAPTNPNDNTILDFIVITIRNIDTPKRGNMLPINDLFETELEYETYINFKRIERMIVKVNPIKN